VYYCIIVYASIRILGRSGIRNRIYDLILNNIVKYYFIKIIVLLTRNNINTRSLVIVNRKNRIWVLFSEIIKTDVLEEADGSDRVPRQRRSLNGRTRLASTVY